MPKQDTKAEVLSLIRNIIKYCEEKRLGSYAFPVEQVLNRVVAMTGKSARTVSRIRKDLLNTEEPRTPVLSTRSDIALSNTTAESNVLKSRRINLDDADRCILRNKIISMYTVTKTAPTLKALHAYMVQETGFQGCKETLRKIILQMGYRYQKCQSYRKCLMERYDIVAWRARYLRFIVNNDSLGETKRPVVYLDETYVHKNYTVSKCWQSDDTHGVLKKDGAGQRWIVAHAGGTMGFINNALLVFKSKSKSGDYHDDMNYENFAKWFAEQLLPNIPPNSIIIMDNASYHSVQENKAPASSSKKIDILSWLSLQNIPHNPSMLKCELLETVKTCKPPPEYKIDNLAQEKGHIVLRLPPYHCDLNPIELIWSMVKRKVAAHNLDTSCNIEALIRQACNEVQPDLWQKECDHIKNIERQYIQQDQLYDEEEFIIQVDEDDDNSNSDMEWTDTEV